jgi:Glycogen recognition site of AMP-activated protein kinase
LNVNWQNDRSSVRHIQQLEPITVFFGREGDEWVCRIDLEPGKYSYKFIIDGNWILDPANPVTEEDAAGNVNSILVKERAEAHKFLMLDTYSRVLPDMTSEGSEPIEKVLPLR